MSKYEFKKNKLKASIAGLSILFSLTGCGISKKQSQEPVSSEQTTLASTEVSTEAITEIAPTEVVTTEEYTFDGELNIKDNYSIEMVVNNSYEEYNDFYVNHGISKDQIRDIIFVLNDVYKDEDGKLIIDEDRIDEAYSNIKKINGDAGSSILQKMDNINTIENDPIVGPEVQAANGWKIEKYPTLTSFIDRNISGGQATYDKVKEYEVLRDNLINTMNETETINREEINNFVIKMEIGDYNSNKDNMDNINKNGQAFELSAYKNAALNFAAKANNNVIYLEGYDSIDQNIKINPTDEERFLENDVITLVQEGLISPEVADSVINEVSTKEGLGYTIEEQELLEKYALSSENLKLLMSYAHYLTTMANQKYRERMCDEINETKKDIQNIRENTTSLNDVKRLVLSI